MNFKEFIAVSIFFAAVTLIFFYKIFFGLIPLPSDLIVGAYYPWLSYKWENYNAGVPVHNPKLSDAVSLYYPFKSLAANFVKKGELPLWNPYMFGGYPLLANVQAGLLFPTIIFYLIFAAPVAWTIQTMSQPFLASLFMYLLLRHFRLSKLPSVFGALIFGFGGSTILWIQWNTQAATSLFFPILILLEDKYLISKSVKWGVLISIFLTLQILAGYLPIIPFSLIGMAIWYLFRSKRHLSDLRILFFIILGLSLSAIFLLPVVELIKISQRTVETLGTGSPFFAPENLINLIAPDFFGNPATGNFWGRGDNMDMTIYAGATALIFPLFAIKKFFSKTEVKFALCLILVTLVISISNPLSIFLYKLGLWGGPSITMNRANFLINFSLSTLGAYGISAIINSYSKLSLKPVIWILSIIFGVALGLFISKQLLINNTLWLSHISIGLKNLILPTSLVISVLILILLLRKSVKFRPVGEIIFILVLVFELFRFGWKFNTFSLTSFIYPETPISKYLEKFPNDRFASEPDIFPANMWLPFRLSSIEGYDGIYPVNAARLLAVANSSNVDVPPQPRWGILQNFDSKIIDETNTRFIIAVKRDSSGRVSDNGQVAQKLQFPKLKQVFEDKGVVILENTNAIPRVYLTNKVIKASDKEALKLMIDNSFPIRTTSISDFKFNSNSSETLKENLTYEQITNSHILIKTNTNIDAYLVVLDSFYPGWKAFVDGKEVVIHRTNYNFKGLMLPKGTHKVEFIYRPNSFKYGAYISAISLAIITLLLLTSNFQKRISKNK